MSDYTKVYDGADKDNNKSVLAGADFDVEFDAIETAIATKIDKVGGHTTDSVGLVDVNGNLISSEVAISTDGTLAGDSDSAIPTEKAVKAYADSVSGSSLTRHALTNTTSGTSILVSGIPSGIDIIHIGLNNVGFVGVSNLLRMAIGDATSTKYTGYSSSCTEVDGLGSNGSEITTGFYLVRDMNDIEVSGKVTLMRADGNNWILGGTLSGDGGVIYTSGGHCTSLVSELTHLRFDSIVNSQAFNSGNISIMYE